MSGTKRVLLMGIFLNCAVYHSTGFVGQIVARGSATLAQAGCKSWAARNHERASHTDAAASSTAGPSGTAVRVRRRPNAGSCPNVRSFRANAADDSSRLSSNARGHRGARVGAESGLGQVDAVVVCSSTASAPGRSLRTRLAATASGQGAELASEAAVTKPKRRGRGRPPKAGGGSTGDGRKMETIATSKTMPRRSAKTVATRAREGASAAATDGAEQGDGDMRAEVQGRGRRHVIDEQVVLRNAVEETIRAGAKPTLVSKTGFLPLDQVEDIDAAVQRNGSASVPLNGEDHRETDEDEDLVDGEVQESAKVPKAAAKQTRKGAATKRAKDIEGEGSSGSGGGDADDMDAEEARQDEAAEAIKRQGLKVGAFGKERLVYHNDYVVHEELGFCRYLAPEFTEGVGPDEIMLQFADMELPISKDDSHLLTRYRAADAARVPLSVVAEQSTWLRHKQKVQERVQKQAVNVMDLYAKRARVEREPCRPDGPEMDDFCKGFEHDPTPDQVRCLQEIENDMIWRKIPMDRLLCGDVGFGKTEVAIRAMFRMVHNRKQVALLAPTTILAAQHYRTLMKRMPSDVRVALLRGGNTLGSRDIKEAIRNCTVDVVVGTHSLLSRKVEFPNLGLLVIDEEQKFGVNQKEKLKVLTTGVDVLTLTATPIPRTLHMSLTGIRDLSTIFSPPAGRQNVTTYIMKATDDIVKRAITREMARGGQVFVVVPRINQIEQTWQQISRCVPEARVAIGHSKVKGLEDVVLQFTLGRGDILLATSIIENGIDMPNVNSIVVMDSHMFGLSQLYQMRGRVGRSNVAAYTYLLYPPGHALTNEAKRRLKAMRELSHLGSGFELANRDLEIRGAGNIFGTDQSGDLKDIGYELYMNMLEKAIVSVRGTEITPVLRCEVDMGFGTELEGSVPADYMTCDEEERAREVDRLRVCNSFRELVRIAKEWVGAYSDMPTPVRRLFKHTHLNTACRLLGVSSLSLEYLPAEDPTIEMMTEEEQRENGDGKAWNAKGLGGRDKAVAPHDGSGPSSVATGPSRGDDRDDGVAEGAARLARERAFEPRKVGKGEEYLPGPGEVPFAVMRGPDVEQERWEILLRQGPLTRDLLRHVRYRGDVQGVAVRGVEGEEAEWLRDNREEWLDHLLSVLLPLVEYVETKQSLQVNIAPPTRNYVA